MVFKRSNMARCKLVFVFTDYGFVDYEGMRDYEESNEDDNKMVHSTITNQKVVLL